MLHTSKLRSRSRNGFTRAVGVLALLILLPLVANAYTVILRDGRSVEIPADFSVTRAGITYEHAPGLYVTIQMTSIDIAATERANNEGAGALLARAGQRRQGRAVAESPKPADASVKATRPTLTNKELEAVRLRREQAEAAYDKRRRELGLPSLEETRIRREEELRRYNLMAAQAEAEEAQAESYWRARAEEIRTAMAVNEAELRYLNSKMKSSFSPYNPYPITSVTPFPYVVQYPNGFYTPTVNLFPQRNPFVVPRDFTRREPLPGRTVGTRGGGQPRGPLTFPRGPNRGFPRRWPSGMPGNPVLPLPVYAPLAYGYADSYEESALRARINELGAERAKLQTRWNLLEEEARRAGVPPGWLRP